MNKIRPTAIKHTFFGANSKRSLIDEMIEIAPETGETVEVDAEHWEDLPDMANDNADKIEAEIALSESVNKTEKETYVRIKGELIRSQIPVKKFKKWDTETLKMTFDTFKMNDDSLESDLKIIISGSLSGVLYEYHTQHPDVVNALSSYDERQIEMKMRDFLENFADTRIGIIEAEQSLINSVLS